MFIFEVLNSNGKACILKAAHAARRTGTLNLLMGPWVWGILCRQQVRHPKMHNKVLTEEKPSQATHARHLSHGRIPASYLGNSRISQLAVWEEAVRFTKSLSPHVIKYLLSLSCLFCILYSSCCIMSCLHCQSPHSFNISPKNSKKCDGEANHKLCLNATLSKHFSTNPWRKWTPVRPSSWAQSCPTSHHLLNRMLSRLELLAGCKQAPQPTDKTHDTAKNLIAQDG